MPVNDKLQPSVVGSQISHMKNSLVTPEEAAAVTEEGDSALEKRMKEIALIYGKYENYLRANNLVDFDDLLKLPYEIMAADAQLREQISGQYQYLMVDEYQDTNELQLRLLKQLTSTHNNICVVGDDDQSIYGWRGANVKNILCFDEHFDATAVIKLEENYRSTQKILTAANELIAHNRSRHEKKLTATRGEGKEVEYLECQDETDEAQRIARRIRKLIDSGESAGEIAVLFRINALSRSIEEGLNREGVPYQVLDSVRFYERLEIKDAISYLRLIINPEDDFSLKRIVNKPKRGIGKTSIDKLEATAAERGMPIFTYLDSVPEEELTELVGKKNSKTLKQFTEMISALQQESHHMGPEFMELFEKEIGQKVSQDRAVAGGAPPGPGHCAHPPGRLHQLPV